ncbi:MAG: DUF4296 domain-containing protein [Ignavibacteria bacterium]|jgi:hypothetical protein
MSKCIIKSLRWNFINVVDRFAQSHLKLKQIKYLIAAIILVLVCISCSEKEILPEDKLIEIYVDLLVAQDTLSGESVSVDSVKNVILNKYNTSDLVYRNTIDYYNESTERWEEFFNKALKYVEKLKAKNEE